MTQWAGFLAIFLIFAVPQWDQENWRALADPYAVALRLERGGTRVVSGRLSETQMGFTSLRLRHRVPVADDAPALRALLASEQPVVALVDPAWWAADLAAEPPGSVLPTAATGLRPSLRDRAPLVVVNPAGRRVALR
jgi:hypothetical protein